ncbi:hypothetical protein CHITON_0059 [Thermococcus chitonophagus]|nr:hypothetical protein CHITON_0059 [Thermococcus chitonophagus]
MLRIIALRKRMSLKEVMREALKRYVELESEKLEDDIKKDPIWKIIGKGKLDPHASQDETWGLVEWPE